MVLQTEHADLFVLPYENQNYAWGGFGSLPSAAESQILEIQTRNLQIDVRLLELLNQPYDHGLEV